MKINLGIISFDHTEILDLYNKFGKQIKNKTIDPAKNKINWPKKLTKEERKDIVKQINNHLKITSKEEVMQTMINGYVLGKKDGIENTIKELEPKLQKHNINLISDTNFDWDKIKANMKQQLLDRMKEIDDEKNKT